MISPTKVKDVVAATKSLRDLWRSQTVQTASPNPAGTVET